MSTLTVQNIQGSSSSSNTISVASGHVLNAPGHVIQTVYATQASQESTTSTSFVNTSLAATITPTSASNKILVLANVNMYGDTNDVHSVCTVYRGTISGTNIGNGDWGIGGSYAGASPVKNNVSCAILDSPSTTGAQTYTVAIRRNGSSGTMYLNVNGERSTIVLQEIAQ